MSTHIEKSKNEDYVPDYSDYNNVRLVGTKRDPTVRGYFFCTHCHFIAFSEPMYDLHRGTENHKRMTGTLYVNEKKSS
jgi:hypothetical protein